MNWTAWKTPCAKLNLLSMSHQCQCSFSNYFHNFFNAWPKRCKLLTRLRLTFSHLGNLKFRRKFKDCLRPSVVLVMKLKQVNTFFLRCQFLASERHNLHDDLCLIDPAVISFDREYHLNVLLYGSLHDFNDKINKEIILCIIPNRADHTGVAEGTHG